jgi:hypothetical protein
MVVEHWCESPQFDVLKPAIKSSWLRLSLKSPGILLKGLFLNAQENSKKIKFKNIQKNTQQIQLFSTVVKLPCICCQLFFSLASAVVHPTFAFLEGGICSTNSLKANVQLESSQVIAQQFLGHEGSLISDIPPPFHTFPTYGHELPTISAPNVVPGGRMFC